MGKKPMRECCAPGCHALTREGYCAAHMERKTKRHSIYDKHTRNREAATFYGTDAWKKARQESMRRHYGLCQDCLTAGVLKDADMVHHVKPLREYPELALVQSNLRPLCDKCHAKY